LGRVSLFSPVILEGTPHRKCHIEDPLTALSQTKAKHCLFIVLDCFLGLRPPRNDASRWGVLTIRKKYDCTSHQTIRIPFPGSSVRRVAPPKDDGRMGDGLQYEESSVKWIAASVLKHLPRNDASGCGLLAELNHKIFPFKPLRVDNSPPPVL
jgi:hypothetical protein